jgi:hypothetical protein
VIELRSGPLHGSVTCLASSRESGSHVIGICRLLEVGEVATRAVRRRTGVLSSHVTLRALHSRMCSGEREGCVVVVERRGYPSDGCVADLAFCRQAGRLVIGIRGVVVIRKMA